MNETRLRLGEILVDAGVLGKQQLTQALAVQKKRGLRLGQILLQEGFISEPQLVQALSRRLSIPWVSLEHVDIPDELLDLVPAHVAEEFFLIPVYIQTLGRQNRTLFVAMNDPTDEAALRFVSATAGMPVKAMVAGPSDISTAIQLYYYGVEETEFTSQAEFEGVSIPPETLIESYPAQEAVWEVSDEPPAAKPLSEEPISIIELSDSAIALMDKDSREPAPMMESQAPPDEIESGEPVERNSQVQREVEKHMFGVGGKHRGMSLTLLDGTKIDFGGASRRRSIAPGELEREALLRGLREVAQGVPPKTALPSDKWESYMAALLQVLFKKNLLFYEEFMKALKNDR